MPVITKRSTPVSKAAPYNAAISEKTSGVNARIKLQNTLEYLEKRIKDARIDWSKLNWIDIFKFLNCDILPGEYMEIIHKPDSETFSKVAELLFDSRNKRTQPPSYCECESQKNLALPDNKSLRSNSSVSSDSSFQLISALSTEENISLSSFSNKDEAKAHLFRIFMARWEEIANTRTEEDQLDPYKDELNSHDTTLREICKIVNSKAKDLDSAWPEDVQQSKISQENLKTVRRIASPELFHPLRSVQYNNKT
ncbi:MAG: hypothetical protein OXC48_00280 [Endozoicomonadaceae bacterium]|nr:hypothetical protein [Endozoicomonadaceae bacterium]